MSERTRYSATDSMVRDPGPGFRPEDIQKQVDQFFKAGRKPQIIPYGVTSATAGAHETLDSKGRVCLKIKSERQKFKEGKL